MAASLQFSDYTVAALRCVGSFLWSPEIVFEPGKGKFRDYTARYDMYGVD